MKINAVDFNDSWVASFASAEEFADSPQNAHLYPELGTVERRKDQLKAVWNLIVKPVQPISHDSEPNDDKPEKSKRPGRNKKSVDGNSASDGTAKRATDGEGLGQQGQTDNLRGEDKLLAADNGEEGAQ